MEKQLYISPRSAESAAQKAVSENRADSYRVKPSRQRNDDRSWDFGFVAILMKSGQAAGFA
ncbi:hypothetical protein [Bradyrhizobium sp. DASA03007]|uniref:hypothetical protein n=1 Tax=unclassified Bradyrhizobium TaxID=2631580 RepID=UPI003F7048B3